MKYLYISIILFLSFDGVSQIQGQDFYSYRLGNMFNLNPAYTNYSDGLSIYTSGLTQAKGVANNTKTFTFGAYSKLSEKQGLGGGLISDSRGAFGTTKSWLSYAYTAKFNADMRLHLGIKAGVLSSRLNQNRIEGSEYLDLTDPTLNPNYFNRTQFVTGLGGLFQWKKLDFSLSLPHLVVSNSDVLGYFCAYSQYTIETKKKLSFIPSVSFQRVPFLGTVFSGFFQTTYNNSIWLKAGYQSTQNIFAMVGLKVENIQIGYGYRINTGLYRTIATGSHELTLGITIGKKAKKTVYNPTLNEINFRLSKLSNKKVNLANKNAIIEELKSIKELLKNTSINETSIEASNEANALLKEIELKIINVQNNLNGIN